MRDVAALAGVSVKTVSRVVNCEAGVSPEVRERVVAAAARLDYRHNLAASNLRRGGARTGVVGALVQDIGNSFSAGMLRAVEDALRPRNILLLAASLDEVGPRERDIVANLLARRVDGLVLMPASERQDYLAADVRAGLPIVFADRRPRGIDSDSVTVDNAAGADLAIEHLLAHGHRRIGVITDLRTIPTAAERLDGVRSAYAAAGLPLEPSLVVTDVRTPSDASRAAVALLDRADPPTAFFSARNVIAEGVLRTLAARGRHYEIAHIGFDDFPLADLLEPGLTVIRQDAQRLGEHVGERLLARLDGDVGAPRHTVFTPTLVARGSGEITPPG